MVPMVLESLGSWPCKFKGKGKLVSLCRDNIE